MTTQGSNITKENIVEQFKTVMSQYNDGIVWHSGDHPFTPTSSNNYSNINPVSGSSDGYDLSNIEDDISDSNITAASLVTIFQNYATLLSRIRRARLIRYYGINSNSRGRIDYDQTNIASLSSTYEDTSIPIAIRSSLSNIASGRNVSAQSLDEFINVLSTTVNTWRTTTQQFEEFYCHSSCHSSCHGSI